MKTPTLPEETDGYSGLYGEVVTEDIYKLKLLKFVPDLIFDIGANIGLFTSHAASLFPDAKIVSVEPHPFNFDIMSYYNNPTNATLLNKALGRGKIWRPGTAANGAGECYLGEYLGFRKNHHAESGSMPITGIDTVTVEDLFDEYWKKGLKTVVKVDCEGAENSIFDHEPSMKALRRADYIAMEVHHYSGHGGDNAKVKEVTKQQLATLETTHNCHKKHVMFYAMRKGF